MSESGTEIDLSVIICTYNRSGNLPAVIQKLEEQVGVEGIAWEIVVVDNNSSDDTAEVVARLAGESPLCVCYVFEPEQGLNHARNRGVQEAKGRYVAFVDDDILVDENWLRWFYRSLVDHDADATGGRIHLDKDIALPRWITRDMYGFLGYQDFGDEPFRMDGKTKYPFGGNMAFNKRIFEKVGMFNVRVGRKGEGKKRGELFKGAETELFRRMAEYPESVIVYEPNAIVYHQVLSRQITKRYFITIHYNAGYQKATNDTHTYGRRFHGVPLFLFAHTVRSIWRYLWQCATCGRDDAFRQLMTVGNFVGQLRGYWHKSGAADGWVAEG